MKDQPRDGAENVEWAKKTLFDGGYWLSVGKQNTGYAAAFYRCGTASTDIDWHTDTTQEGAIAMAAFAALTDLRRGHVRAYVRARTGAQAGACAPTRKPLSRRLLRGAAMVTPTGFEPVSPD